MLSARTGGGVPAALLTVLLALAGVGVPGPSLASPPDPEPFPVTRDALIAEVLTNNPDLDSARAAWDAAVAIPAQVGALPDPVLAWSVAPLSASADAPFGQRVELRQSLPFPGTLAPRRRAAEHSADALEADLEALQLELALAAARLVDELGRIERSLALLDEHAALLEELQASATATYSSGRGDAQDPIQAEVEAAHVEHRKVVLRSQAEVARARLRALLGADSSRELHVGPVETPGGLEQDATREHPATLAADERIEAADEALLAARRSTRPDLALSTSYSSMWMEPGHRWMVGAAVEVPLQVGARRAAVDEASARAALARADAAAVVDQIDAERGIADARLEEAQHVVRLYSERLLPAARLRVETARSSFESGRAEFDTLIGAERQLREAELQFAAALAQLWTALAERRTASGFLPTSSSLEGPR